MNLLNGKWILIVGTALAAATVACCGSCSSPPGKTISAGMKTDFFSPYTISVGPDWTDTHESDPAVPRDMLTLTNGDYSLLIGQGGGVETCIFGGAPTPTGAAQLWLEFPSGVEIKGVSAEFMRGTNDGITHVVCQKTGDGFSQLTTFGFITYTTPNPADPSILAEMDAMVASMTADE